MLADNAREDYLEENEKDHVGHEAAKGTVWSIV